MVAFNRNRLQIFVSSTFSDLIAERQAAVEAILTAGHIPAGMELFTSGDESQMEVIKQWIDESDVYLLILGGRYGSVEPTTGLSYTQLEYQYAVDNEKPLFACVIKESALEERVKERGLSAIETDHQDRLRDFRALVLTRLIRFWEDSKDIKIAIGETLSQFARRGDLVGWVRADQGANMPALADEVTRLSRENAELRKQLAELEIGREPHEIRNNRQLIEVMRSERVRVKITQTEGHIDGHVTTLDLFRHSGPYCAGRGGASEDQLKIAAVELLGVAREQIDFSAGRVTRRLLALGLLAENPHRRKYWVLTDKGQELLRGLLVLDGGSSDK